MCDGRYFPIGNRAGASAVELCRSFCPNAPTQIFSGSKIDHSVAPGGRRYSEIPNAFVYREKMVPDCTCDGKSATGLVRIDPRDDPTLRPGDFVATGQGLMAYRGGNGSNTEFSAISNVPGISANLRSQLSATRVAPGKQPLERQPDPEADGEARHEPQRAPARSGFRASKTTTSSAIGQRTTVSPGDSIPNRLTSPFDPVLCGAFDQKIARRLAGSGQLRAHAGIIGNQRAVRQSGPIACGCARRNFPRATDRPRNSQSRSIARPARSACARRDRA